MQGLHCSHSHLMHLSRYAGRCLDMCGSKTWRGLVSCHLWIMRCCWTRQGPQEGWTGLGACRHGCCCGETCVGHVGVLLLPCGSCPLCTGLGFVPWMNTTHMTTIHPDLFMVCLCCANHGCSIRLHLGMHSNMHFMGRLPLGMDSFYGYSARNAGAAPL